MSREMGYSLPIVDNSQIPRVREIIHPFALRARRLVASCLIALFWLCALSSVASAQIVLDGTMNEPEWHKLGDSAGGPEPKMGPGHEINALYADIDATYFYIGVAGNVQNNNRILVFIDSMPGGYTNGNFGRIAAPLGVLNFNQNTTFDDGFSPNYVLSISTNNGQTNYVWELYTLSGSSGYGGGPNLYLGDRNDGDLAANPANDDLWRGFESRLTYNSTGSGVDIAINQSEIRMMAMYINDNGTLSNQFISPAHPAETNNFGSGPIHFHSASPDPVYFGHTLVINEVDYIQPGANVAEFIEIKNITNYAINIDSFHLRLARGINSPTDVYRYIDLPSININPNSYFVICTNPANVPNCNFTVPPPMDLLENTIPAAVALVQNNVFVDLVSYGGNTALHYSEGPGVVPADDGTQQALGISRIVDGVDTNRNHVDFALRCVTPGHSNSMQGGGCGPATPTHTPTPTPTSTGMPQTPTPTGTATPTATPRPTGLIPATATGPAPLPPPAGCPNVLVNGAFESSGGWEFGNDPVPGKYTSIPVHGGVRSVQLGITPESGYGSVYSYSSVQHAVSIPEGATVQLRWWHFYKTELSTLDSASNSQDRQEMILLKPNGDTLRIVQRVRRNDSSWQQSIVDLTEYAGQSFVLYFNVVNYGGPRTWAFIDDVELLVCPPRGGVRYGHPSAPPGVYPGSYSGPYPGSDQGSPDTHYGAASQAYYALQYGASPPDAAHRHAPPAIRPQEAAGVPSSTPSPTSTPTGIHEPPATHTGNSIEQSGYSLMALSVENPSVRYAAYYQPHAGQKFVAVEIIVGNVSGESFSPSPLYATLVDTSGFLYAGDISIDDGQFDILEVNPGEMVRRWVGFVVPHDTTPASLRYQFFGPGVSLQVGLGSVTTSSATSSEASGTSVEVFSAPVSGGATPTPTVTATNTGMPSPSPTPSASPSPVALAATATAIPAVVQHAPPTPALMLLADRRAIPENCVELVENGTFDALGSGWSHTGSQILPVYAVPEIEAASHSGQAIRLGLMDGTGAAGISVVEQQVQLPKESNKITLRFRYFPRYETPLTAGDFQYVDIYHGETGQLVGRAFGVQRDDRRWLEREFDLSALAGEAVRLFFMVSNDGVGGNMALYIDDVSILACRVPKSPAPDSLAAAVQAQQTAARAAIPQPLVVANAIAVSPEEEFVQGRGFSFGRMGGLLAVLGIAGVALILLPLTRRFSR